ncbi:hypothetical protein VC83_08637 [Pseudogymnoascus destructans]|uniref:Uncharacterized protein n=2 Tax=Pseudogymnoascus destructans TaxID=655981 RepID=L8FS64_PSED2|nr:uncharacterized protein VC83_08637 [Pseudogymnoascus destructans]ELR03318.1 hypothetical protein GMDG_06065 [Pseudogymnoascus destructans 20631-21]OAF54868.1 hypothetical protein VC83_08637 [Pseudogymnoascus destructans]
MARLSSLRRNSRCRALHHAPHRRSRYMRCQQTTFLRLENRFPGWSGLNAVEGDAFLDPRHCNRPGAPMPMPTPKERKSLDVDELVKALRDGRKGRSAAQCAEPLANRLSVWLSAESENRSVGYPLKKERAFGDGGAFEGVGSL